MRCLILFIAVALSAFSFNAAIANTNPWTTEKVISGYKSNPDTEEGKQDRALYIGLVLGVVVALQNANIFMFNQTGEKIYCQPKDVTLTGDMLVNFIEGRKDNHFDDILFDIAAIYTLQEVYPCN